MVTDEEFYEIMELRQKHHLPSLRIERLKKKRKKKKPEPNAFLDKLLENPDGTKKKK